MQADSGYDTTDFQALRQVLGTLNEAAIADGLVAVRDGVIVAPRLARADRKAARRKSKAETEPDAGETDTDRTETGGARTRKAKTRMAAPRKRRPDRSRAAAARLLALLAREPEDQTPTVPGTSFTEAGVTRLLAHLRRRRSQRGGAWLRFLKRSQRFLGRPVPAGIRTVEGVGLERLQVFGRQLDEIASDGWSQFRTIRAARRRRLLPTPALAGHDTQPEPSSARRKGSSR